MSRLPPEWEPHERTIIAWPSRDERWDDVDEAGEEIAEIANAIAQFEPVTVIADPGAVADARPLLSGDVELYESAIDDAWLRDSGPVVMPDRAIGFAFNGWGGRWSVEHDATLAERIAAIASVRLERSSLVLEGGAFAITADHTLIAAESCLLNPNRNPTLTKADIERLLRDAFAVDEILWLGDGIEGDDTDGHIDDLTRFVGRDTVVTVVEPNRADPNHAVLDANLRKLGTLRVGGRPLTVVELPMPEPQYLEDQRLPASYANFYVANDAVLVPVFGCAQDDAACAILRECFPRRRVVAIDCRVLIAGLGALHCLTQQVPSAPEPRQ